MYIRWKKRQRKRWRKPTGFHTLSAYLVESHRVNGRPRQKTTYLASIWDKYIDTPTHRDYFWWRVEEKVAALALDEQTWLKIAAQLEETVPKPSPQEVEQFRQALDRQIQAIERQLRM
jgi:hypothetical protein